MNSNKLKELSEYLKKFNSNINVKNGNDVYLSAVICGNLEIMKFLEKEYNWDIHVKDNYGFDAYLLAVICGNLKIMKYLEKEHNWDIHFKDNYGNDAYLSAIHNGKLEIMKYLEKEHNWDIHVRNNNGKDALYFAQLNNHQNIIKYLKLKNRKNKYHFIPQNKNEECYICLEKFKTGDKYCKCHNGHIYHEDCFFELSEDKCCVCNKENILKVIFTY